MPSSPASVADVRRLVETAPGPAAARDRMLAALDEHGAHAFERACADAHFTGSALIVDGPGERALLLHHRKLGRWLQTGGHADGDVDLAGVALKEAGEESGIAGLRLAGGGRPADVDVHLVEPPGEPAHLHLDVRFVVVAPEGADAVGNHESLAVRWFPLDDLAASADEPGMRRLAGAARTLVRR